MSFGWKYNSCIVHALVSYQEWLCFAVRDYYLSCSTISTIVKIETIDSCIIQCMLFIYDKCDSAPYDFGNQGMGWIYLKLTR